MQQPSVRAVDVGYGHVKWTDGYDGEAILAEAFPSQSVLSQAAQHQSAVWQERDTFLIPIKDGNDIAVLPGTPQPNGRASLIARLARPRNVEIVRGVGSATTFCVLRFSRDVGHVQSFDLTPLGGAWIAVQTHEERKTPPFDILKTELTAIEIAADGAPKARYKIPVSTDDGEVPRPSRLGKDGRFYALLPNKRGVSVLVSP